MTGPPAAAELFRLSREELLALAPVPPEAIAHGVGSDVDGDLDILWAVAHQLAPEVAIELGTRQGLSTRTLAHAMRAAGCGSRLMTIDPDPGCRTYLQGVDCVFLPMTGERAYDHRALARLPGVDLLFVDTDPHTYEQTRMWLYTWVLRRLRAGGVAAFHDIVAARPEIRVRDAVLDFISHEAQGWGWHEYPSPRGGHGIGLLWRMA